MLPRWHIVLGAAFTFLIWYFAPQTEFLNLLLVFLASVFIDTDHYICAVMKSGKPLKWKLKNAFEYHEKIREKAIKEKLAGVRNRGDFHLFHTIEFHALIGILGIWYSFLFYIFIGMVFHSLLDVFDMLHTGYLYRREYFFFNWLNEKVLN